MNATRRKQIQAALDLISEARGILEDVKSEEQDAYDALPDSFRESERGEKMENAMSILEDAVCDLENWESTLEEAKE